MGRRSLLLRPRMVVLHVLVLAVVLTLAWLGTWQVQRLGEARERVTGQQERLAATPVPASELLEDLELADTDQLAMLEFRRVVARGTWRPADEVLQRGRSHQGRSGFHVLTPLDLVGGSTVLVRRGWVPFDNELRPPVPDAAPPAGEVVVDGYLERSIPQPTGPLAQRDAAEGELDVVFHADLERLGPQVGTDVLPMVLHLEEQAPAPDAALPVPAPRPPLENGPHLSYAIQWFSFALIGTGMYVLWLWRRVRGDQRAISDEVVQHS